MEITVELLRQKRKKYQDLALKCINTDSHKRAYNLGKAKAITDLLYMFAHEEIMKKIDKSSHEVKVEAMSLVGGIDMYSFDGKRYKEDVYPEGREVYFLNRNGYESERERARKYFEENEILTVKEIYVGRSSSEVEFFELPNERFNTVMFADYE